MAEHVSEARLYQRGAAAARDRAAERIELLEKSAGRIAHALEPEWADVLDQPRPQCRQIGRVEQSHVLSVRKWNDGGARAVVADRRGILCWQRSEGHSTGRWRRGRDGMSAIRRALAMA